MVMNLDDMQEFKIDRNKQTKKKKHSAGNYKLKHLRDKMEILT